MQLRIVAVGKVRERYIAAACEDFSARLAPYYSLEVVEVKAASVNDPAAAMAEEGERILGRLAPDERVWLLDREGVEFSSIELSRQLTRLADEGTRRLTFVVAGTFGASDAVRRRAAVLWSLSKLTLLHEWARALVLEQLYRAAKIARNEPYHH